MENLSSRNFELLWYDETNLKFTEIKHWMRRMFVLGQWGFRDVSWWIFWWWEWKSKASIKRVESSSIPTTAFRMKSFFFKKVFFCCFCCLFLRSKQISESFVHLCFGEFRLVNIISFVYFSNNEWNASIFLRFLF